MKLYLISGLGADHRAFSALRLHGIDHQHLDWLRPGETETLQQYASRFNARIDHSQPVAILGLSFGGILAQEMVRQQPVEKLILLSSARSPKAFHPVIQLARQTRPDRLVPAQGMKDTVEWFGGYFFSVGPRSRHKAELLDMVRRMDPWFLKWAVGQVLTWSGGPEKLTALQILGKNDRIFPANRAPEAITVPGAGHLVVRTHARVVSDLIRPYLGFKR